MQLFMSIVVHYVFLSGSFVSISAQKYVLLFTPGSNTTAAAVQGGLFVTKEKGIGTDCR